MPRKASDFLCRSFAVIYLLACITYTRAKFMRFSRTTISKKQQARLDEAKNYQDWCRVARDNDEYSGAQAWREREDTDLYDHRQIRHRLDRLREYRAQGDDHALLFILNEGLHGNMGGMGRATLYQHSLLGTKCLIEEYVQEIIDSLAHIASSDIDTISLEDKYDFFHRASLCFGRPALMLSGGGSLGHFHLGVIKALNEQQLLPKVLSGSSAGAVVSAILGTRSREAFLDYIHPDNMIAESEQLKGQDVTKFKTADVVASFSRIIPDLTFQEAFELTGHYINISVAPAELHQTSRLLNAITSPNVFIREAVMASCAVPGVYPSVTLYAKNVHGNRQAYLPQRRWVDGSVSDDLPAKRLARLYGVNYYIGSLINPIVALTGDTVRESKSLSDRSKVLGHQGLSYSVKHLNSMVQKYGKSFPRLSLYTNMAHSIFKQDYTADVALMPRFENVKLSKLTSRLEAKELLALMRQGELATWASMDRIRICTSISQVLDGSLDSLETELGYSHRHNPAKQQPTAQADQSLEQSNDTGVNAR
jgi:NTE family protein